MTECLAQRLGIARQAGQADVCVVGDGEDLVVVRGDGHRLLAQSQVARDRDAVLADHGDDGSAVVLHDTHAGRRVLRGARVVIQIAAWC